MEKPLAKPKLDIFALYSLTLLLFALIAGVILAVIVASLKQSPSFLGVLIVAGMVILPLRHFLRQPELRLRMLGASGTQHACFPSLIQDMEKAAQDLGIKHPPRLIIPDHSVAPTTLGTWRRRYVVLGRPQAECLDQLDAQTRRTFWLHELAHLANGDIWKTGLSQSLLHTSVTFMAWSMLFILGIVLLSLLYGVQVFEPNYLDTLSIDPSLRNTLELLWPDPALLAPMLEQIKEINVGATMLYIVNGHLVFIFCGGVLSLLVWRRLVQVREFYADARAAAILESAPQTWNALLTVGNEMAMLPTMVPSSSQQILGLLRRWINRLLPIHSPWQRRQICLQNPVRVFGSWKWIGLVAGATALLLDVLLTGPFTLAYVSSEPAHIATLSGLLILALWLFPHLCQTSTKNIIKQLGTALGLFLIIRIGWLLLNIALVLVWFVIAPAQLATQLNQSILISNKILTDSPMLPLAQDPRLLVTSILTGVSGFQLLISVSLMMSLGLGFILFRRLLTWYAFPAVDHRLIYIVWSVILVLILALGFVLLPISTALILGELAPLFKPASLLVTSGICVIIFAWGVWFWFADRRWGRRCPACGRKVAGWFEMGKQCPQCGAVMHLWLKAKY